MSTLTATSWLFDRRAYILAGVLISLPGLALILYSMGDAAVVDRVLLIHSLIFDTLTTLALASLLRDYRHGKPFAHPVTPANRRRMSFGVALFSLNVLLAAIAVAIMPLDFPTVAAIVVGIGFVSAPVIALTLLNYAFQLNQNFGKVWVKALDFPYLLFAFIGLLRVIANVWQPSAPTSFLNTFGLVLLSLALSIRLAKATIEVFFDDWVQAPKGS